MKLAILCLPRFEQLKRLILGQLAQLDHTFYVFEERAREFIDGGLERLRYPANVQLVLVDQLDLAHVVERVEAEQIDQVISFSDRAVVLAARVRERFGMRGNSSSTESRVVHKGLTRQRLHEAGLSRVGFRMTKLERLARDLGEQALPVVVKPTSLGASFCVELIESLAHVAPYIERCRANRVFDDRDDLIIEHYLPGRELSVEGIVTRGRIEFLGVTESLTSGPPYFVGTGHDFFADHEDAARLHAFVSDVIECLQLVDCPFHIELKYVDDGFEVVEAHTRYGGAMIMELVEHATGVPAFSHYIETLMRGAPSPHPRPAREGICAQHLLCTPAGVVQRIELDPVITHDPRILSFALDYGAGDTIAADVVPLQYAGYVTFRAEDRQAAQRMRTYIDQHFRLELCT